MNPIQKQIFQAMKPEDRLKAASDLYACARKMKEAGLRFQHPEWSDEEIEQKMREIFLYATT